MIYTMQEIQLKYLDSFKYLHNLTFADGSLHKEITSRNQKASQALSKLKVNVLQQNGIAVAMKLLTQRAMVLSSLLYGCDTCTLHRRHIEQLEQFHKRSFRTIMNNK